MSKASLESSSSIPQTVSSDLSACFAQDRTDDGSGAAPSPEEIRQQLERIIDNSAFETSQRNRRFLRYVVEETLAGRADRIKAYSVATVVFGRTEDFDPHTDPIIRIEASRLRRALDHYYLSAGRDDPVRVAVPKGSYVPTFERAGSHAGSVLDAPSGDPGHAVPRERIGVGFRRRIVSSRPLLLAAGSLLLLLAAATGFIARGALDAASPTPGSSAHPYGPSILVVPFDAGTKESDGRALLGERITQDVMAGLTRFADLSVFSRPTAPSAETKGRTPVRSDYVLSGRTEMVENQLRASVLLVDARLGQQLWSATFTTDVAGAGAPEQEVADRIVRAIAGRHGAIFAHEVQALAGRAVGSLTPYQCVLRHRLYWQQPNASRSAETRECLERAIQTDPAYATAHAALALVRIDPIRLRRAPREEWPSILDDALLAARRAVDLAPDNPRGYQALHHVKWLMGEVEQSIGAGERALALNPNDAEMMAELAFRYGLRAEWAKAVPLLERAFAQDPDLPSSYRVTLSLHHYVSGRFEEALAEATRIDLPDYRYAHMMRAMAYAQLGRLNEAAASVQRLLQLEPQFARTIVPDLQASSVHPDLIRVVIDGLRKAGLDVTVCS